MFRFVLFCWWYAQIRDSLKLLVGIESTFSDGHRQPSKSPELTAQGRRKRGSGNMQELGAGNLPTTIGNDGKDPTKKKEWAQTQVGAQEKGEFVKWKTVPGQGPAGPPGLKAPPVIMQ